MDPGLFHLSAIFRGSDEISLCLLDIMMPDQNGVELCRQLRQEITKRYLYLIFLTSKSQSRDVVVGLESGADDYVTKPIDPVVLRARLQVGARILRLMEDLVDSNKKVKRLSELLPLCAWCRKIRDDGGYWRELVEFLNLSEGVKVTHGICPDCKNQLVSEGK